MFDSVESKAGCSCGLKKSGLKRDRSENTEYNLENPDSWGKSMRKRCNKNWRLTPVYKVPLDITVKHIEKVRAPNVLGQKDLRPDYDGLSDEPH
jgi:hypothetical protein